MAAAESREDRIKRLQAARIAEINRRRDTVPPTPEYLEAKAQLAAERKARRHA